MKLPQTMSALFLILAVAVPSSAQTMKPGLWDVNTRMKSPGGELENAMKEMQAVMASLPEADRKAMDAAMAKQGVKFATGPAGSMNTHICISKEMAEQKSLPLANRGNCTEKRSPIINGRMKISYSCTKPASHGEGEVAFNGDSAFTMQMNATATERGKPEQMSIASDARWLAADCGDIKPQAFPAAK